MGSDIELIQTIEARLESFGEPIREGIRDIRTDLRNHVRDEGEWQDRMETEVLKLTGLPAQVEAIGKKVEAHEVVLQQSKGAMLAGKAIWALLGVAAAFVVWLVANVLEVKVHTTAAASPPREYPTYRQTAGTPPPPPPASAASAKP